MTRRIYQAGLTLIELMIGLSLGLVMLGSVVSVMVAGNNSYQSAQRFSNLQSEFGFINDSLLVDLRSATAVTVTGANNILTITSAAGTIIYSVNADNNLQRQLNADPASLIAENVNLFSLSCLDETRTAVNCASAVTVETHSSKLCLCSHGRDDCRIKLHRKRCGKAAPTGVRQHDAKCGTGEKICR